MTYGLIKKKKKKRYRSSKIARYLVFSLEYYFSRNAVVVVLERKRSFEVKFSSFPPDQSVFEGLLRKEKAENYCKVDGTKNPKKYDSIAEACNHCGLKFSDSLRLGENFLKGRFFFTSLSTGDKCRFSGQGSSWL